MGFDSMPKTDRADESLVQPALIATYYLAKKSLWNGFVRIVEWYANVSKLFPVDNSSIATCDFSLAQ